MNLKHLFLIFLTYGLGLLDVSAQQERKCGSMDRHYSLLKNNPLIAARYALVQSASDKWISEKSQGTEDSVYRIPVVVHVVYHTSAGVQNISDSQIFSQINSLNADFSRTNFDTGQTPTEFASLGADCEIKFELAVLDPSGNPTNGITRTSTSYNNIGSMDNIYYTDSGGHDVWDPDCYYNIWVCKIDGSTTPVTLGKTFLPGTTTSDQDGTVIDYRAFGTTGTALAPYHLGRTLTHEAGHYLNLLHIWDNSGCTTDDGISDTPLQHINNTGCPSFPKTDTCSPASPGVMFMNYMDHTDDACMNIFTLGQKTKMRSTLNNDPREKLRNRTLCNVLGTQEPDAALSFLVFPNPSTGMLKIRNDRMGFHSIAVRNILGETLLTTEWQAWTREGSIDLSTLPNGIYFLTFQLEKGQVARRLVLNK